MKNKIKIQCSDKAFASIIVSLTLDRNSGNWEVQEEVFEIKRSDYEGKDILELQKAFMSCFKRTDPPKSKARKLPSIVFNEWFLSLPDDYSTYDLFHKKASTVRLFHSLYRAGIKTKKDLKLLFENYDKKYLITGARIKAFGEKSYNEVLKIIT